MQVRYQAAPRPDRNLVADDSLAAENPQHFFELEPHLSHDLLALADIRASLVAAQLVARAADREALFVQEAPDLADADHIRALGVAAIAPPLDRLELRELLLPVAQHMGLDAAQFADFTDREITLAGHS